MRDMILGHWTGLWIAVLLIAVVFITLGACDGESENEKPTSNETPSTIIPPTDTSSVLPATAEILFTSNQDTGTSRWEIYSMDSQGLNITRITDSNENHFIFGIDPSRRYIAATRGTEEQKRLWLLDLETGEETPLTDAENHAEGRTFSLDGEWVVFWMVPAGETLADIYKVKRDGTGLTNLTNTPHANEGDPAWSHRGDKIAFCYNDGNPNRFVLKSMDTDGNNARTIYDPEDSVATAIFPPGVMDPSWSPDDEWILVDKPVQFTGDGENAYAGIWRIIKIRADGSEVVDITGSGAHANSAVYLPSFSPDGDSIVFTSRYGPEDASSVSLNIFKMDRNGGSLEQLTDTPHWDQFAVWIR